MLARGVREPVVLASGVAAAAALALRPRFRTTAPLVSLAFFSLPILAVSRQVPMLGDGPNSVALMLAWLLAVFMVGAIRERALACCGLAAVLGGCALYAVGPGAPAGSSSGDMLAALLFSGVVPWLAGFAVSWQQRARAADRVLEQAQTAAAMERSRIAREVHDLVAHSVSLMVVQAEAAEALLTTSPDRSLDSLHAVQQAGRQALGEMRKTVAALRSGDVAPTPGLADLPALLDSVRTAGLPVTVATQGTAPTLPPDVDRSVYRVIQEALTNALRHSDHTGALVRLAYQDDTVIVSVVDQGQPRRRALSGGHGLIGLRERITAIGGHLDVGRSGDGSHVVHATVPIPVT